MKKPVLLSPRAALFIGAALLSTPAFAQDTPAPQQSVAPPPILVAPAPTPPPAATISVPPPAQAQTPPPQVEVPAFQPSSAPRAATTRTARTVTHTTTRTSRPATPAEASAPARAPAPAPAAAPAPEVAPPVPVAPQAAAPAPEAQTAPATAPAPAPATRTAGVIWPWLLGGAILVLGAIALLLRRRRTEYEPFVEAYEPVGGEPAEAEPLILAGRDPVAEPEMLPLVDTIPPAIEPEPAQELSVREVPANEPIATDAAVADATAADLAGVTGGAQAEGHRPWIEFGMRPIRAGTSEEEAMVEIELTVGNAGDMPAKNVRISTFMLADPEGSDMDQLLTEHSKDKDVPPVTIEAGEGTRIDATLAVPKGDLGRVFNPVVVADARYKLPDGTEGRTSAAFRIGRPGVEGLGGIGTSRAGIYEDVEAELDELLERA